MRRLFVRPEQLAGGAEGADIALDEAQARHLTVLRLEPGTELELFDGRGGRFLARLSAAVGAQLQLVKQLEPRPRGALDVQLGQALSKADKLELVIQKATELGASRIVPFEAERSVVKLDGERAAHKLSRWEKIAQEAARQCGRAEVPQLDAPMTLAALLARAQQEDRRVILLDTGAQLPRLSEAARGEPKLLLVIGPEGGFSPQERALAEESGAAIASLGALVLRTETAGLAALAVVRHLAGELG